MKRLILAIFLIFYALPTIAGTSINVPIGDRSYEFIYKIAASGLIKSPIVAQRPWTRAYFAKLIDEALRNRDKLFEPLESKEQTSYRIYNRHLAEKRFIDSLIKQLVNDFSEELDGVTLKLHPLNYISAVYTYVNNPPQNIPSNGYGKINATIHPLVAERQGTDYVEGSNIYVETEHSLQASPYFSAYVRPLFQFSYSNNVPDVERAYINDLYAKTGINNLELEIGRDQMVFGQGKNGGLLLSENPRGLDMAKLSTPEPLFGVVQATAFAVNLGPEYSPKETWLFGGRLDLNPVKWFDLGFGYAAQYHSNVSSSEKIDIDTRITLPELRGTAFYGEVLIDDNRKHDLGIMAGFYMPHLDYTGKWSLRGEYERIGKYVYRSDRFSSGWALNTLLLGNMMGPDSNKAMATLGYSFSPVTRFEMNAGYLQRSNGTSEHHVINTYKFEIPLIHLEKFEGHRLLLNLAAGWDYVVNKDFSSGNNKADLLCEVGLKMLFPEF